MKIRRYTLDAAGQRRRHALSRAAALVAGALVGIPLAGCGGGGDAAVADAGPSGATVDDRRQALGGVDSGGTGAAAFFSGVVAAVSPVVAGGVQFDVAGAAILDADGTPLNIDLAPGMTARIDAEALHVGVALTTAQAVTVRVGEQVLGPVDSVDLAHTRLLVLGQRIDVTTATAFAAALPGGLAQVQPGMLLRVWGLLDISAQRVVATRVDVADAPAAFVVRGMLTALNAAGGLAAIGGLNIVAPSGGLDASLAVGQVVRARLQAPPGQRPALLVSMRADPVTLPNGDAVEIEGRITRLGSAGDFDVDGVQVVAVASAALVSTGNAPLALGARAQVKGRADQGVLRASSVQVESDELFELEGTISGADPGAQTFVLGGITVSWTASTTFVGGSSRLIGVRRKAAVKGHLAADHLHLLATLIHVEA